MWRWIIRGPTTPPNTVKHHLNKHRQTSKSRVPSASNVRARCSFSISCRCSCAKVVAETCRASQKRFPTHGDGNCTQKPQIRSCLVFKPSILGSNILNGIPPGKIQMSPKKGNHFERKFHLATIYVQVIMLVFRWYEGIKFTMSTRPEPLQVSSWARPPGKKTTRKIVGSSDES